MTSPRLAVVFLLSALFFASPAFAAKKLTCTNRAGKIVFDICGVSGCPATMTVGTTVKNFTFERTRRRNGALFYSSKRNTSPTCSVTISPLKNGERRTLSVTCQPSLSNAKCVFSEAR